MQRLPDLPKDSLTDEQVLPNQSTQALVALPDGTLGGGTTTKPGSGVAALAVSGTGTVAVSVERAGCSAVSAVAGDAVSSTGSGASAWHATTRAAANSGMTRVAMSMARLRKGRSRRDGPPSVATPP